MKTLKIRLLVLIFSFLLSFCLPVYSFDGYVETEGLYYPNNEELFELRSRFLVEERTYIRDWLTLYFSGRIDGLISDREKYSNDILVKIDDAYIHLYFSRVEMKLGYTKIFWGKLNYLTPTDIVNPLNISQLFLKTDRRGSKLPVFLSMFSAYFGRKSHLDFILVPFFQKGVYDELNENSSPFNITQFSLQMEEKLPSKSLKNIEYGVRLSSTFREIDWSLYYFTGFQDFPSYRLEQNIPQTKIEAQFLKGNMFGYDFELIKGKWGIRGEGVFFTDLGYQKSNILEYVKANSFTSGLGVDRSFGDNYLSLSMLYKKIFVEDDLEEEKDEITLIANLEREFSYGTKKITIFSIYNVMSDSKLLNGKFSINLLENLWLDLSLSILNGEGEDTLGKFKDNDFYLIKCRYYF